ncbi:hypothetical protein DAERI_060138 [Deinococcus aerius]|uniref:Uncharacterized protein n=1 Tax=Deinococcus aerius TaxID=200253 RepID=A0A2I9DI19_9DEIO|nr:hypothetical protein [Deinococcus aerius]GBF05878.1 hypothetical protein DAERI_060138 [Deinococcus aerius]
MTRRRPSGLGSNSRKFSEVRMPDGKTFVVVRARSAATLLCLAEDGGGWPDRGFTVLDFDLASARPGDLLEIEGGRAGQGLGEISAVRVIESRARVRTPEGGGNYGQLQRWVLVEPVPGYELGDVGVNDLEAN